MTEPGFAIISSVFFVAVAEGMLSMRYSRFFNPWLQLLILAIVVIHLVPFFLVFSSLSTLMRIVFSSWFLYLGFALISALLSILV